MCGGWGKLGSLQQVDTGHWGLQPPISLTSNTSSPRAQRTSCLPPPGLDSNLGHLYPKNSSPLVESPCPPGPCKCASQGASHGANQTPPPWSSGPPAHCLLPCPLSNPALLTSGPLHKRAQKRLEQPTLRLNYSPPKPLRTSASPPSPKPQSLPTL